MIENLVSSQLFLATARQDRQPADFTKWINWRNISHHLSRCKVVIAPPSSNWQV